MTAAFHLIDIVPSHADVLAHLHDEAFFEGWGRDAFASALAQPGALGVIAVQDNDEPLGFALLRASVFAPDEGGEAEVLTIATRPAARRRGVARRIMVHMVNVLRERGVTRVFLEVAQDNPAAMALYSSLGFVEVGRRKAYYARAQALRVDALVMALIIA